MFLRRNTRPASLPYLTSTLVATIATAVITSGQVASETREDANSLRVVSVQKAAQSAVIIAPNYAENASTLRHWDKPVVTVRITGGNTTRTDAQTAEVVARGIHLWNSRLDGAVRLEVTDAPNADITVGFVVPNSLPGKAIGRTDVTFRLTDQVLLRAQVKINQGLSEEQLLQVAAHEMGHALGIQGHSPDKNDLMFPYAHVPAVVTDRDLNTMFVSYGVAPRLRQSPLGGFASVASSQHAQPGTDLPSNTTPAP